MRVIFALVYEIESGASSSMIDEARCLDFLIELTSKICLLLRILTLYDVFVGDARIYASNISGLNEESS